MPGAMQHLIDLLAARDIRVEIDELLRLQAVLDRGDDWDGTRLTNAIVAILATCSSEVPQIREAVEDWLDTRARALDAELEAMAGGTEGGTTMPPSPSEREVSDARVPAAGRRGRARGLWLWVGGAAMLGLVAVGVVYASPWLCAKSHCPEPVCGEDECPFSGTDSGPTTGVTETQSGTDADTGAESSSADGTAQSARSPVIVEVPQVEARVPVSVQWLGMFALLGLMLLIADRRARVRHHATRERRRRRDAVESMGDGPSLFWLAPPASNEPVLLDDDDREKLIWGVGRLESDTCSREFDEQKSVDASLEQDGYPVFRYRGRRVYRRVWIWLDASSPGLLPRRLAEEARQALFGHGLDIEVARYWGIPDQFQDVAGRKFALESLEDEQAESIVVVLTDGDLLLRKWDWRGQNLEDHRPEIRALLHSLARWKRLSFVSMGSAETTRALTRLLASQRIKCLEPDQMPAFIGSEGLIPGFRRAPAPQAAWIWAACCAIYPLPVPELEALELRRALDLPVSPYAIGQLQARSVSTRGLQFEDAQRRSLIERLRVAFPSGPDGPSLVERAVAHWRERTIDSMPGWETDRSGRGMHRRLVVALLDLWNEPERAADELHRLRQCPHFEAAQVELEQYRFAGDESADPRAIELPSGRIDLAAEARHKLDLAGLGGVTIEAPPARPERTPAWLHLLRWSGVAVLILGALQFAWAVKRIPHGLPCLEESGEGAVDSLLLARRDDTWFTTTLHAIVAGEWRRLGDVPRVAACEFSAGARQSVACVREFDDGQLHVCPADSVRGSATAWATVPLAIVDTGPGGFEKSAARTFAHRLLDSGIAGAVWVGSDWPRHLWNPESAPSPLTRRASKEAPRVLVVAGSSSRVEESVGMKLEGITLCRVGPKSLDEEAKTFEWLGGDAWFADRCLDAGTVKRVRETPCPAQVQTESATLFHESMQIPLPVGIDPESLVETSDSLVEAPAFHSVSCIPGAPPVSVMRTAIGYDFGAKPTSRADTRKRILDRLGYPGELELREIDPSSGRHEAVIEIPQTAGRPHASKLWLAWKFDHGRTHFVAYEIDEFAWNAMKNSLERSTAGMRLQDVSLDPFSRCYRRRGEGWQAMATLDQWRCFELDSCHDGLGRSGGECYKWTTGPDAPARSWDPELVARRPAKQCYRMSPEGIWMTMAKLDEVRCFELDACQGGLGAPSGICHKWVASQGTPAQSWSPRLWERSPARCFVQSTETGRWEQKSDASMARCRDLDTCKGRPAKTGGCRAAKWSRAPDDAGRPWPAETFACYWLSNRSGTWELAAGTDLHSCFTMDACNGGLGRSGGGCYKWALGPGKARVEWKTLRDQLGKVWPEKLPLKGLPRK